MTDTSNRQPTTDNQTPERTSKVMSLAEAVSSLVPDRSESLWVGGMHMHNVPMALVRECIRQGKRFETFYAGPSSSLVAELLIGSGLVDRVVVGYIGFEHIGLAPMFRRAVESGTSKIEFVEADSGSKIGKRFSRESEGIACRRGRARRRPRCRKRSRNRPASFP